ncbi:hypothetical protein M378DRAFT_439927 [Amanita muscaria Koide BX008]|uniref:F-box domain-containing protein n=1 Tax=Amanita muscaria (strain Koide BX008) TaxID=946122 RepID=A0A0C2WVM9_AMAMK|nr:hypothetical protein M378DRAFT_439927 [Amanita muscaria Koide BX008]
MPTKDANADSTSVHRSQSQSESDSRPAPVSICSMPLEVLSNIFKLGKSSCEDELEDDEAWPDQNSLPFEILVSHVNSHFRRTALSSSTLWSSIRITFVKSTSEVATYIERSGCCKLDVQLTLSHSSLEKTQELIELILPHSFRWRTFYYRSVCEAHKSGVLSCLADIAVPMLEVLSLSTDETEEAGNPAADDILQQTILIKGAPMLNFVRLRGFAIYSPLPPMTTVRILHLDQTKSVPLRNPTFRHVLSSPHNLEHLSIYGDMVADSTWPTVADIIHFPRLFSLRIYDVGGWAYTGLLLGFNAPSLKVLTLMGVQDQDLDRLWSIEDPSRFSSLQHLIFWDFDLLVSEWHHVFRLLCGITNFSSYYRTNRSTILHLLAEPGSIPLPWPHLASLSIIFDAEEGEEEEILLRKVINARCACGHPLDVMRLGVNEGVVAFMGCSPIGSTRIEYFRSLDKWPLGRDFRDWDDNLFL